jgi:hypothetical protein
MSASGPSSVHQPPPGAKFMNTLRWGLFVFLMALAVVSVGSYVLSRPPRPRNTRPARWCGIARCTRATPPTSRASARSAA